MQQNPLMVELGERQALAGQPKAKYSGDPRANPAAALGRIPRRVCRRVDMALVDAGAICVITSGERRHGTATREFAAIGHKAPTSHEDRC